MTVTALIDADIVAFQQAIKCQDTIEGFTEEPIVRLTRDEAWLHSEIDSFIEYLLEKTEATKAIICLSGKDNFRYDVLPSYKHNRKDTDPPLLLSAAHKYLESNYKTRRKDRLEADDVMGILSTDGREFQGKRIICTTDKDLYQIPGYIFNWNKADRGVEEITHEVADMFHMVQTLVGDTADGYQGVLGIGEGTAYKLLLEGLQDHKTMWETVVEVYEDNGCAEEDALCMARVARMCRYQDYDFINQKEILWNP
jgi:DNA polymerase-1